MEQQAPTMNISLNTVQDYLSIGYLYLLILGILSDSIYYGMLGINILSYSTILDVLLSPIVKLTDNILLAAAIMVPTSFYLLLFYLQKQSTEKMKQSYFSKISNTPLKRSSYFLLWLSFVFTSDMD
ncbi:MAG: hypothetical protein HC912_09240 [Saprospiraceae bacterium]|nr:hypothetical protein [Saprospiraceae bacterium]